MTSHLEPEEVRALADPDEADGAAPADVAPRDFARPLRLSRGELERVRGVLRRTVPAVEDALGLALRNAHSLELLEVEEVNAEGLFEGVEPPLATLRFDVGGQPGWLRWEPGPALASIEVALGAATDAPSDPRELTSVERGMLASLLGGVAGRLAAALGAEATGFTVPAAADDLGTWRDGGARADRRRLAVRLAFGGPGGPSELALYLPGVEPVGAEPAPRAEEPALPPHLEGVRVSVAARLGRCRVPLAELLAVEVGDVIPLETPADEPLTLVLEDRPAARGVLGSKNGNLAVRVTDVGPTEEEE